MALKPASTLLASRSPIVDKGGNAMPFFAKMLQGWDTKLANGLNQIGELIGEINAATKITGRTEGIGTTVGHIDDTGAALAPMVDFSRPYLNKTTDHINDGTGNPLAGGIVAHQALVASTPIAGQALVYDGTDWNPDHPSFSGLSGEINPSTQMPNSGVTPGSYTSSNLTIDEKGLITAAASGSGGGVAITGSPATGNLSQFSGAATITNGDLSGDVATSGTLATTIVNSAVTLAKIQNAAASSKLLGSGASGLGAPYAELTLGTGLSMSGTTLNATGGGTGTVTTTGSPASGNLSKFSGASSVTNGDLSGDVTTSGTLAATVVKVNGASVPTSQAYVGTNGSGQIIAATTPASGALSLLAIVTSASAASLAVTTRNQGSFSGAVFQSDFDDYLVELIDVLNITNSVNIGIQVSTNGGSSYDSSASYTINSLVSGGGVGAENNGSATNIALNYTPSTTVDNTQHIPLRGTLHFRNPLGTTYYKTFQGAVSYYGGQPVQYFPHVIYRSLTAVNAFQVLALSGNIQGTVRVYGLGK